MSARLTDGVAQQIMGEIHGLLSKINEQQEKVEDLARIVTASAESINRSKNVLHRQNESFLIDRIKEVTSAVVEIKSFQAPIQDAATQQVAPLVQQLKEQVESLVEKDKLSTRLMQETNATQRKISLNMTIVWLAAFAAISVSFLAGFLLR